MSTVRERLVRPVSDILDVDVGLIHDSSVLVDDLGMDDLAHVEIILAIENTFDINIPDSDAQTWDTFGSVLSYVERRMRET